MRMSNRRGQALAEFAILAPVLILVLLGVAQIGMLYYGQLAVQNAARDAGRAASLAPTTSGAWGSGGEETTTCPSSQTGSNPACIAAWNAGGGFSASNFTITISGANAAGMYVGGTSVPLCSGSSSIPDPSQGQAFVAVTSQLKVSIFIPFIGQIFVNSGTSSRVLTYRMIARVAPCIITTS